MRIPASGEARTRLGEISERKFVIPAAGASRRVAAQPWVGFAYFGGPCSAVSLWPSRHSRTVQRPASRPVHSVVSPLSFRLRCRDTAHPADPASMESVEDDDDHQTPETNALAQEDVFPPSGMPGFSLREEHSLPVKRRIKALKQLQLVTLNIEAKFYEEVHALECKYNRMCAPVYEKRGQIAAGVYEPTDAECVWDSDDEDSKNDSKSDIKIEEVTDKKEDPESENVKGIPEFWLTIFKNVGVLAEMVEEHDEPILKHLYDIKVIFLESNPMGFVLEFHFNPNEYFSNSVLTKEYIMKCSPEKNDPFSFEGPEIYKSKGCTIDWKKGKNVTVKTIKKNQKHKSRGSTRTVVKTVRNESFFNFFTPPVVPEGADTDLDDDTQRLLTSDFEIGHYIRERIVPRAILYFTGEGLDDEGEEFEEEEGDDDEEDDDDEDDDDEAYTTNSYGEKVITVQDVPECKQQ